MLTKYRNKKYTKNKKYYQNGGADYDAYDGTYMGTSALASSSGIKQGGLAAMDEWGEFIRTGPREYGSKLAKSAAKKIESVFAKSVAEEVPAMAEQQATSAAEAPVDCTTRVPDMKAQLIGLGCSLLEGTSLDLVEHGVTGQTTGVAPSIDNNLQTHNN